MWQQEVAGNILVDHDAIVNRQRANTIRIRHKQRAVGIRQAGNGSEPPLSGTVFRQGKQALPDLRSCRLPVGEIRGHAQTGRT